MIIKYILSGAVSRVSTHLSLMNYFKRKKMLRLARLIANRLEISHGVFVSPKACLPDSVRLRHPIGVVIGEGVVLGERVTIYQNVTLGGARIGDAQAGNYPNIGDDTVIFAGAVIVGNIKIGKNCVIGANSVVLENVPDNSVAVGAPARVLAKKSGQSDG